jgi:hypothetical protein
MRRYTLCSVLCVAVGLAAALLAAALTLPPPTSAQQVFQSESPSRCISSGVSSVAISTASAGNVQLVALAAGETVHVCGFVLNVGGAVGLQFITGTGTACATDETDLTGVLDLAADGDTISVPNSGADQFQGALSSALCLELSSGVQTNGVLTYVQY